MIDERESDGILNAANCELHGSLKLRVGLFLWHFNCDGYRHSRVDNSEMAAIDFPQVGRSRCDLTARAIALTAVLVHLRACCPIESLPIVEPSTFLATGLLASLILSDGNSAAHGIVLRPREGWRFWIRFTLLLAGAILLLCIVCAAVFWSIGRPMQLPKRDPSHWPDAIYWMCLRAPLHEEIVYRVLLTVALLPLLGSRGTIVAGGILFGLMHVLGGNPGPDNLVAGFFLQWAYLRSGTVLVPLAMHAGGNAIALSSHFVNWSLFGGAP